ncbi:IclR family transcriptional regulator [Pseudomonas sp.]|uniref:IclR family transcriptional regulator n=1 Tax=Pseudomonas sp. TaxID=306 RepID=UPI003D6F73C0
MPVRSRQIQSVEKAMSLLEHLKAFPGGASLAEICALSGLTKSTAHGLLHTLVELGYVSHGGTRYSLGSRVWALASTRNDFAERIVSLFTPALGAFNGLCRADCFLAVPSGTHSYLTLAARDANGQCFQNTEDSQRDALRTSAVGKIFLAHNENLTRRLRRNAPLNHSFEQELIQVRQSGFALDNQGSKPGLNCMAIPLRISGQVVASLSMSGVAEQLRPTTLDAMARQSLRQLYELVKY